MHLTIEEWNNLVKAKVLEDVDDEPKGFLMVYQLMKGKVKWKNKIYNVVGWAPPTGKTIR